MNLVWSASDEAQEYWSSSQLRVCSYLFPRGCTFLQNRLLRIQLVTVLVWQSILGSMALGCTTPGLHHSLGAPRVHQQTCYFAGNGVYTRLPNGKPYTSSVDPSWRTVVIRNFALCSSTSAYSSMLPPLGQTTIEYPSVSTVLGGVHRHI